MSIKIALTDKQADLILRNTEGWIDAGSGGGKSGLTKAEYDALNGLCLQIRAQQKRRHTSQRLMSKFGLVRP